MSYEEELKRQLPIIQRLVRLTLLGKKLVVEGRDNFVLDGPNIITGNHVGSYQDIASMLAIAPRDIFFTANELIFESKTFNRMIRKYLRMTLKEFGFFFYELLTPLRIHFVNYITTNISRIGTIPVNLEGSKRQAITRCQDYLEEGKAVVLLQGGGRIKKAHPFPYVSPFRRGPSIMSYNLLKERDISVPVTPIAFFGTHIPYVVPGRIKINVGRPMFIKDYWADGFEETVEGFRHAMEMRVRELFLELIRS